MVAIRGLAAIAILLAACFAFVPHGVDAGTVQIAALGH